MNFSPKIVLVISFFVIVIGLFQACNNQEGNLLVSSKMPDSVSYNFDIRPILSDKCLACHGPDANKRKAGLRLDQAESAYQALKENPTAHALVPGKPNLSELYLRISSKDTATITKPEKVDQT